MYAIFMAFRNVGHLFSTMFASKVLFKNRLTIKIRSGSTNLIKKIAYSMREVLLLIELKDSYKNPRVPESNPNVYVHIHIYLRLLYIHKVCMGEAKIDNFINKLSRIWRQLSLPQSWQLEQRRHRIAISTKIMDKQFKSFHYNPKWKKKNM